MRRIAGVVLWITLGLCLSAWIIRSAAASDYYEPGVLLMGAASFFCLLACKWRVVWFVRAPICVGLLLSIGLAGIGLENFGRYRLSTRTITARAMLVNIGDALNRLADANGELPDCAFPCMADALAKSGEFKAFEIPYAGGKGALSFQEIPNRDPWNCRWFYKKIGSKAFVLRSSGADRRFNTVDDVTVTSAISDIRFSGALPPWRGWLAKYPSVKQRISHEDEPGYFDETDEKVSD